VDLRFDVVVEGAAGSGTRGTQRGQPLGRGRCGEVEGPPGRGNLGEQRRDDVLERYDRRQRDAVAHREGGPRRDRGGEHEVAAAEAWRPAVGIAGQVEGAVGGEVGGDVEAVGERGGS
jgi:hypothetical protein